MKVKIKDRQIWDVMEFGDIEFREDWRALEALLATIPPEMVPTLADKETAKDAWDAIAAVRIDSDCVCKAKK